MKTLDNFRVSVYTFQNLYDILYLNNGLVKEETMLAWTANAYFWIIVLVVMIILEAISLNLTAIWFAVGALAALFARLAGANFLTQMIVFVVLSALSMAFLRPFAKKVLKTDRQESTNADRIIGQSAIVIVPIDNLKGCGQIKIGGQIWSAVSETGEPLEEGTFVRIVSITGVKASVIKMEKENNL